MGTRFRDEESFCSNILSKGSETLICAQLFGEKRLQLYFANTSKRQKKHLHKWKPQLTVQLR